MLAKNNLSRIERLTTRFTQQVLNTFNSIGLQSYNGATDLLDAQEMYDVGMSQVVSHTNLVFCGLKNRGASSSGKGMGFSLGRRKHARVQDLISEHLRSSSSKRVIIAGHAVAGHYDMTYQYTVKNVPKL